MGYVGAGCAVVVVNDGECGFKGQLELCGGILPLAGDVAGGGVAGG